MYQKVKEVQPDDPLARYVAWLRLPLCVALFFFVLNFVTVRGSA